MKRLLPLVLCLAALSQATTATAQTYKWKDSSGRTIISDNPPPGVGKGNSPAPANPAPASSSPAPAQSMAEKEMEFKKRQQEKQQKAEKEAKEEAQAAERKENCTRAKRALAELSSNEPLSIREENGERRSLDGAERQREVERAQKLVADYCK